MVNRSIYKYVIDIDDTFTLTLPKGSEIISVINQFDNVCIYAIVNTETTETEEYSFKCYGTGHTLRHDDTYKFLGTVSLLLGNFVCHIFYKKI